MTTLSDALLIATNVLIDQAIRAIREAKRPDAKEDIEYLRKAKSFINIVMGK